ncbi:MAG: lipopolysaccharide transport periplasmic protein LptA [Pseudomonadota bacterium]|jgi:lipopolysaccharide export system protein LptA
MPINASKICALPLGSKSSEFFGVFSVSRKDKFARIFVAFLMLLGATTSGLAEKADRQKPMNIEADALKYDDLRQTSVFTGRVLITKGSIQIRGGQVDVRQDAEGYQYGLILAEAGKLAFFRQKRDGVDEYIEGEAEVIEYDGKADVVKFVKRASLRRFRGAVLADDMSGAVISYDSTVDVFTIDGVLSKGAQGGAAASGGGRIRAMLTPKPDPSAAELPPAVPAAPLKAAPLLANPRP